MPASLSAISPSPRITQQYGATVSCCSSEEAGFTSV
jgi:hypothetical protein